MSNFSLKDLIRGVPDIYVDSIKYWYNIKESLVALQDNSSNQLIWYNNLFKVEGKTVFCKRLFEIGIWAAHDLYENGQLIPCTKWRERGAKLTPVVILKQFHSAQG